MLTGAVSRLLGIVTTSDAETRASRLADPSGWDARWVVAVLALHALIGFSGRESEPFSTAYDIVTIVAAVLVVLRASKLEYVAAAVGYVTSAEVFWRMTSGTIIWPATGKFALSGLLALAMVRLFPGWRRVVLAVLYLALFLPGVVLAFRHYGVWESRDPITFNLMGPVALAVCVVFFSQARLRLPSFRLILWAIVPPIVAIATNVLIGTISAGSIRFTGESSFATSGGFRPTYVSAALSFGVLACFLLAVNERNSRLRVIVVCLGVWFLGQALLTFARGGVISLVVAVLCFLVAMARPLRRVGRVIILLLVVGAVVAGGVFLLVNSISGGKLSARYGKDVTGRDEILLNDLEQFRAHPFVGVGVGVARDERSPELEDKVSHTEYSRLLAEQGLFGIVALAALVTIVVVTFRRAQPGLPRALFAAFAAWSLVEMAHSATRIALISYSFGLAVAAAGLVVEHQAGPHRHSA
jgi:O-Antigen ligase